MFDTLKRITALCFLMTCTISGVSQVSTVEELGAVPATQAYNGLGWNVSQDNQWEFEQAAAAGAKHVRFQCGWTTTESQTAPPLNTNTATKYSLQPDCQNALAWSRQYGLQPTIIAAFGPPYHKLVSFTVPNGAAVGATSINIQFASGVGGSTLASMKPFYDLFLRDSDGAMVTQHHAYGGSLITAVTLSDPTHATISLASALTSFLPADGTLYDVNELLYPPAFTDSGTDPSVVAYANYAQFLASQIGAYDLTGEVELWNEPEWTDDPWDQGGDFYDAYPNYPISPGPTSGGLANWGFVVALQSRASSMPANVTFNWAGTHKSGDNSVQGPNMFPNTGVAFDEPNTVVGSESFHPYGNNPEDQMWNEPCMKQALAANNPDYFICNTIPANNTNIVEIEYYNLVQQSKNAAYGIHHSITETGFGANLGDQAHAARFATRQFLGFEAANISFLEFYELYDSGGIYSFFNPTQNADGSYTPLPNYTAMAGIISDLQPIANDPVAAYTTTTLSKVSSYSGTYPLDIVHLVGARDGDTANSELVAVWQRSYTPVSPLWGTLPSPPGVPVTVTIPAGMGVTAVKNLDTRVNVSYATSGQNITFTVSDDPIELLVVPASSNVSTPTVNVNAVSVKNGAQMAALSANVKFAGTLVPSGAKSFTVNGGPTVAATCTGSSSPLTCTANYPTSTLASGSYTITMNVAADANFNANSGTGTLKVKAK